MLQVPSEPKLPFFQAAVSLLLIVVAGLLPFCAFAQPAVNDSVWQAFYWIRPEANYVQFYDRKSLEGFQGKWKDGSMRQLVIAHFGDSHVQSDIFPGELRKQLQQVHGEGGLGMIFPYSTAKTYSSVNYATRHTGIWLSAKGIEPNPKLKLGVSGATSRTLDSSASFTIEFKTPLPSGYRHLKLYCRQQRSSYDMIVRSGGQETFVGVDSASSKPYLDVELPALGNSIVVQLVKNHDYESEFEFYGMSLEDNSSSGLILHCLGIGGSQYGSLLKEALLDVQLPSLHPDLVILDFGTNDYLYFNTILPGLENQIIQVINKVRKAAPTATVLLTTTQDMNRRGINITAGQEFSELIRKVARKQKCPFYDWYWISGGPEMMVKWVESGLAQTDMIHLTLTGYKLKGQMLANALSKSMEVVALKDSLVLNVDTLRKNIAITVAAHAPPVPDSLKVKTEVNLVAKQEIIRHEIRSGETLKSISKKYHVKIDVIKNFNGLKSSRIIAGKYLNIPITPADQTLVASAKTNTSPGSSTKYMMHKVQEKDTLSELAEKYKVSVRQLKNLNGLKTSRIRTGQSLRIKLLEDSANK